MNVPPGIPILGKKKKEDNPEQVLEGVTGQRVKVGTAEFPVGIKDGKPIVGKVTELHLAVQLRFLVRLPLPLADKQEGDKLLQMVMDQALKPEWERARASLDQLQLNLQKAAEMAVKTEYAARQAAEAQGKKP